MTVTTRFRLTDDELIDLFDVQLPTLLEQRPHLESRIYHAFINAFATKAEVAAVLTELREHRSEFHEFKTEVNYHFKQVDQRFDQVDQHFEQVDQHFEQVDQHFEQVDQHFEQVDQHLERLDQRFDQVDQRFDQVDQRFDQVDRRMDSFDARMDGFDARMDGFDARMDRLEARMEAGFKDMHRAIDKLGARWGIRNESIFRQTMAELLEQHFGVKVETRWIGGEQFDCIIYDAQHLLVEISASVGSDIQRKLERKRQIYTDATGVVPARVILVAGAIHSHRAQVLREAGFTVIEPEEDALVGDV
jgi:hypothetical protein